MAQLIEQDRYPKFVADQVLTERSLNQMFGYLEEQQRLTRTTLIGIGILCGMKVSVNSDGTELTISHGVGVTSKGYLVPFPETTYSFYDDTFSPEQEIFYDLFLDDDNRQEFKLHLLHHDEAADVQISLTPDFLKDMVVVIFVELLKVDNKNCDPDSCDDKGCTIEVTHRPLLVHKDDIDNLIFGDAENPFLNEPSCIEWKELKMPKYNVPSTVQFSSATILQNFLNILSKEFIDAIETVLSSAYNSFGYYISEEFPSDPFSGLASSVSFLFGGGAGISKEQLNHAQYYYDFFSDLILAYEELRELCNACLSICCPNEELFPRHLILGYAISSEEEFRHHWIKSPALSCGSCSEERIKFLLKKIALLVQKRNIPRNIPITLGQRESVRITPSTYGNIPLSNKAIPYYYDIINSPNELYENWNHKKKQLKKGETNLSYDVIDYGSSSYYKTPLDYDLEPHNFLRIEGHIGLKWQEALDQINKVKNEKRLPIEVLALNADILQSANNVIRNEKGLTIDEVIEKESFALYALNNPGIQHKAGVTTGGTFILVYNDKPEVQENGSEFAIVEDGIEEFKMMEIERTDNPSMLTLKEAMKFRSFEGEKLKELVDQFEVGTVIADFFVPYISKAIVQSVPPPTPPEITFENLPTLNLRWGKDRRSYDSLIKYEANIDINSTQLEEKKISGTVNLMQVNLLGENDEWLNSKPILHLFKYKPKKRNSEATNKSGFRKEAPNSLSFYNRVNEFNVDRKNMIIDIKQDRYFSVKGFKNEIRAMGLRSAFHNVYFYLTLSVEVNGETIFGKPSKIFKITINENNHFSFHIS